MTASRAKLLAETSYSIGFSCDAFMMLKRRCQSQHRLVVPHRVCVRTRARPHTLTFSQPLEMFKLTCTALLLLSALAVDADDSMAMMNDTPDDDDTQADMFGDFFREEYASYSYLMTNATTGEPIEGAGGIVAPTFSRDKVKVGVFIPASSGYVASGTETVTVTVCEFMRPENCLNETPYPGAPETYACGLSDETIEATGFECDSREVPMENDGDLSVEVELEEDDESMELDDYAEAPSPSPARRLLSAARFGRANPRRSRTLRTAGTRGFGRG